MLLSFRHTASDLLQASDCLSQRRPHRLLCKLVPQLFSPFLQKCASVCSLA